MPDPAITICIPAYKAERYIGETLASIRAQTWADWEVVVVEDGTRDGTEAIVAAFARSGPQSVTFLRHETNQGLPATRNTAISKARGDWIALIDSDDLWTPDHLEKTLARARETGADLVHSGVAMFDSDTGREEGLRVPSPEAVADFPRSLFLGHYIIQPSSVLLRRELCRRLGGFNPACRYVEDREFWLRLIRAGARVERVDAITCRYRQHAVAMTKHSAAMAEGVARVFEANADWEALPAGLRRRQAAEAWLSAARIVLRSDPALARAHLRKARRHRPASARLLAYWAAAGLLTLFKRSPA